MAGAEGQCRFDLDADAVDADARAVVGAVHDKAAGGDRREALEARLHPVAGGDGLEHQRIGGFGAGGECHQCADGGLVRRRPEMDGDGPLVVPILERRRHRVRGIEARGDIPKNMPSLARINRKPGDDAGGRQRDGVRHA